MRKSNRIFFAVFSVLALLSLSCFSAFSAENHYYINELNMNIDLPDSMVAITRESPETDKYFSLFGLDYSTTINNFKSNNIYLQGMYEDSSRVFTVTMLSDENSKSIGNYSNLSDEQLLDVSESFLAEKEYTNCTVQNYNGYVFMQLQLNTQSDGQTVYATQCNTVIDGKNITLTLQPAKGSELTNEDYQTMENVLQSVEFDGHGMFNPQNLIKNPILWIIVMALILLIIVVVLLIKKKRKKDRKITKKEEKKIKNQKILKELAKEYSSHPVFSQNNISENVTETVKESENLGYTGKESADDIITQFRNSKDFEEISSKRTKLIKEEPETVIEDNIYTESEETVDTVSDETVDTEIEDISVIAGEDSIIDSSINEESEKENINIPLNAEDNTVLKVVTPEDETDEDEKEKIIQKNRKETETEKTAVQETNVDINNYFEDEEYDEDQEYEYKDEYMEENSVIGSEESFDQSEDYFDEALDSDIYSRKTVDDEDNYEKTHIRSIDKESVKKKVKTAGAVFLNGVLIFLNGVKSFFIHLGYFCTNLFRLIKRNINRRKHRKSEMLKRRQQEEAKRRREENARRKQQNISKDANGLLKVHSRNEYSRQESLNNKK